MRYGFTNGLTTTVSASATVSDFESWYELLRQEPDNYVSAKKTSFVDHIKDPNLKGYKHAAYVFDHADEAQQQAFLNANAIEVVSVGRALDWHNDMIAEKRGSLGYSDDDLSDRRTLEEMHLQGPEGDKWDKKTPEQQAQEAAGKKQMDQMRKRLGDAVTGSSFDPNPRGSVDDGTFNIRGISVGQNGSVNVSGMKRAGVTTNPQVSANQMIEDDNLDEWDDSLSKEEIINNLEATLQAAGFDQDAIDGWRMKIERDPDVDMKTVVATVRATILNKQINQALQPVAGVTDEMEAMDIIDQRLGEIEGLGENRRKEIYDGAFKNMMAPKPKLGDYKFAQNMKLTALRSMRGEGTPIFHIEVNKAGPNAGAFTVHDGQILLETIGLSIVSNGIFAYEVEVDDPNYNSDARKHLLVSGLVEDLSVLPVAQQPAVGGKKGFTPDQFREAFAGDGTSAVEGHDSFGKHQLGKSEEDYASEMTAGIVGDKGITVDSDALLSKTKWSELPDDPRILLEKGLGGANKAPKEVYIGSYAGIQIGDGNYVMAVGVDEEVVESACINIRHLGTIRNPDGSSSFAFSRDQRIAYGFVVVRGKKNLKVYAVK